MKNKKIILIHKYNDFSGSTKVLSDIVRVISGKRDYEILTCQNKKGFLSSFINRREILYFQTDKRILNLISYIFNQTLLFFYCFKYWNDDVIFYVNTIYPFGSALAGKIMGKKIYFHIHESSIKPIILKNFLFLMLNITSDKVVYVSKHLLNSDRISLNKKTLIYNHTDNHSKFNSNKPVKNFKVLMVCSLKEYKGLIQFFEIATSIDEEKISFSLVLNASMIDINNYFNRRNIIIPSNVTLYDGRRNLKNFYSSASILLNLSQPDKWVETFGLTILEAMSFHCPVIVPPIGGPPEIVSDGVEGYTISCYDTYNIRKKILTLHLNRRLYKVMSIAAYNRSKFFSKKKFNDEILRLFK